MTEIKRVFIEAVAVEDEDRFARVSVHQRWVISNVGGLAVEIAKTISANPFMPSDVPSVFPSEQRHQRLTPNQIATYAIETAEILWQMMEDRNWVIDIGPVEDLRRPEVKFGGLTP